MDSKTVNENLKIYDELKSVPETAKKKITGGRISGMTNISPMWRIKRLTEEFGASGIGWYTEVISKEIHEGDNGEKVAIVEINLYVKVDGEWSKPIFGTGGSMLVANEKSGKHTSDEAFKMAYTDAISVACKALGMGADVYYSEEKGMTEETKYDRDDLSFHSILAIKKRVEELLTVKQKNGMDFADMLASMNVSEKQFKQIMGYFDTLDKFEKLVRAL